MNFHWISETLTDLNLVYKVFGILSRVLESLSSFPALKILFVFQRNQVWCGRAGSYGFRTPALSVALFLGLGCCTALEATAAAGAPSLFYLHLASRGLVITACALLGLVVVCLFRRMDRAAAKTQAEQLRAAFSSTTMSPFQRGSRPALRCAVRALLAAALLLLFMAALLLYQLIHIHLLLNDRCVYFKEFFVMLFRNAYGDRSLL